MGYLNNSSVTVDAILTTKGRQKLASGNADGLGVAYFALGDDEVNYDLWNPSHPLGSDYYGIIIENMPVLEASPIPEQNLKSKLLTLPKSSTTLATIVPSQTSIGTSLTSPGFSYGASGVASSITPLQYKITFGLSDPSVNNNTLGYTVYFDSRYFSVIASAVPPAIAATPGITTSSAIGFNLGDASTLSSVITTAEITLILKSNAPSDFLNAVPVGSSIQQNIFVQGNEIGGKYTIPVYIKRLTTLS
jgi:hypothetical protein